MGFGSGYATLNVLIANPRARIVIFTTAEDDDDDGGGDDVDDDDNYTTTTTNKNTTGNSATPNSDSDNNSNNTTTNADATATATSWSETLLLHEMVDMLRTMFPGREIEIQVLRDEKTNQSNQTNEMNHNDEINPTNQSNHYSEINHSNEINQSNETSRRPPIFSDDPSVSSSPSSGLNVCNLLYIDGTQQLLSGHHHHHRYHHHNHRYQSLVDPHYHRIAIDHTDDTRRKHTWNTLTTQLPSNHPSSPYNNPRSLATSDRPPFTDLEQSPTDQGPGLGQGLGPGLESGSEPRREQGQEPEFGQGQGLGQEQWTGQDLTLSPPWHLTDVIVSPTFSCLTWGYNPLDVTQYHFNFHEELCYDKVLTLSRCAINTPYS